MAFLISGFGRAQAGGQETGPVRDSKTIVKLQSVFGGGVVSSAGGVRRDRGAVLRKNIQLAAQPGQAQTDPGAV